MYYYIFLGEFFLTLSCAFVSMWLENNFLKAELYTHGWILFIIEILLIGYQFCSDLNVPLMKVG